MATKQYRLKAQEATKTTTQTVKNLVDFIQATALVIVGAYAAWAVYADKITGPEAWILAGAAAIIAVRGSFEFLKCFTPKN